MVKAGGDTWFFITADYAFGHALERDTSNFVKAHGGKVLGAVRTPFPGTTDFSSFLVQAQASPRQGDRPGQCRRGHHQRVKQAAEFGLTRRGTKLAALLMFINDVHALGLQTAQGLVCTETFYWDLNDRTRAFTEARAAEDRRQHASHDRMPAATAATLHYLKAVADMGVAAAKAIGADGGRPDEGDADRRRLLRRRAASAPTGGRSTLPTCSR